MRYFLIDKVTALVPGERARGVKCVTLTDEVLHDHFPDYPVLPGVLVLEAAAQLAGLLLEATYNRRPEPPLRALLVSVEKAKFHDTCWPGDTLELDVTLESRLDAAAQVRVEGSAGERKIVRATLTFMMKRIESERVHEQRRSLYRLWTRDLSPQPEVW